MLPKKHSHYLLDIHKGEIKLTCNIMYVSLKEFTLPFFYKKPFIFVCYKEK